MKRSLIAALGLLVAFSAFADVTGNVAPPGSNGALSGTITFNQTAPGTNTGPLVIGAGGSLSASGGGTILGVTALGTAATINTGTSGATIPLLNGANTWSGAQLVGTGGSIGPSGTGTVSANLINGTIVTIGVQDNSAATVAAGGTGNAVGDVLTLNDGCSTHATLTVVAVSTGAVTQYNVGNRGICSAAPTANPIGVSSTTGTGSGATFNLTWGPLSAGLNFGNLQQNNGVLQIGGAQSTNFSGAETIFLGDYAGGRVATGNFSFIAGHNAFGTGNGCTNIFGDSLIVIGTDNLRNTCGGTAAISIGVGGLKTYNQTGTSSNHYLFGDTSVGNNSLYYWNYPLSFPYDTAFGFQACMGAPSGTVYFYNGTCIGPNTGAALTTASNFLILAGGGNGTVGNATFASGSGVILIGSGGQTVDTPAGSTSNYINLENIFKATGTNTPSTSAATIAGTLTEAGITTDATHTDASVCEDTTSHTFYFGSGTVGVCLGTSSARYKHSIKPLNVGITKLMALMPISYELNADHGDPNHELYGFTAEEMQKVLPKLVGLDKGGKPNTADYVGLIPVLVKGVQEEQREIDALKQGVQELTQKNQDLAQKNGDLEALVNGELKAIKEGHVQQELLSASFNVQSQVVQRQQWEIYGLAVWCFGLTAAFVIRRRQHA